MDEIIKVFASVIDYPQQNLPSDVWSYNEKSKEYALKPEVKAEILSRIEQFFKEKGFKNIEKFWLGTVIGSSIGSLFYTTSTDIDVKSIIDVAEFMKANDYDVGDQMWNMVKEVRKSDVMAASNPLKTTNNRPIDIYFINIADFSEDGISGIAEDHLKKYDSLYFVEEDVWLKEPQQIADIEKYIDERDKTLQEAYKRADKIAEGLDIDIGKANRVATDIEAFGDYIATLKPEQKAKLRDRLQKKLDELEKIIQDMIDTKNEVLEDRQKAFQDLDFTLDYEHMITSINFHPDNVKMKLLVKWAYFNIISKLQDIAEDPVTDEVEVKEEDVPAIKEVVASGDVYFRGAPSDEISAHDFPGMWLSKDEAIAEQYGDTYKYTLENANLLNTEEPEARDIEIEFAKKYPVLEEEMNQTGEWTELWMFPCDELVSILKQRGYDGYNNGSDTFVFNLFKIKKASNKININRYASEVLSDTPTDEMKEHYDKRTKNHIALVKKYCEKLVPIYGDEIIQRGKDHDKSKFEEPEYTPYVFTTWRYKCKDDNKEFKCSKEMEQRMKDATEHHIKNNPHHPEFHTDKLNNLINTKDRDAIPDEMIDSTKMTDLDIAEMCADWCAMSEERGNSPIEWADKNVNKRWKFDEKQSKKIYDLINKIWESKKKINIRRVAERGNHTVGASPAHDPMVSNDKVVNIGDGGGSVIGETKILTFDEIEKSSKAIDRIQPMPCIWYENESGEKRFLSEKELENPYDIETNIQKDYPIQVSHFPVVTETFVDTDSGGHMTFETSINCIQDIVLYLVQNRGWKLTDAIVTASGMCERCLNVISEQAGGEKYPQEQKDSSHTHCDLCAVVDPEYDIWWNTTWQEELKKIPEAEMAKPITASDKKANNSIYTLFIKEAVQHFRKKLAADISGIQELENWVTNAIGMEEKYKNILLKIVQHMKNATSKDDMKDEKKYFMQRYREINSYPASYPFPIAVKRILDKIQFIDKQASKKINIRRIEG